MRSFLLKSMVVPYNLASLNIHSTVTLTADIASMNEPEIKRSPEIVCRDTKGDGIRYRHKYRKAYHFTAVGSLTTDPRAQDVYMKSIHVSSSQAVHTHVIAYRLDLTRPGI